MTEIKIKYDLSWIMTRAGQLRKSGDDKSTAMKKAWAEEKAKYNIMVSFPSLNKNDDLSENDIQILESCNTEKCRIVKIIKLNNKEWEEIAKSLLNSREQLWENIGGCRIDDDSLVEGLKKYSVEWLKVIRKHAYILVIKVECEGKEPFYVNTEGYTYARYVGRAA